jgi:rhamnogalacturonyl hydrolase YesR
MKKSLMLGILSFSLLAAIHSPSICLAQSADSAQASSAAAFWGAWPENADPNVLGKRVVQNLLSRPTIEARAYGIIYPEICASYGSLRFASTTGETQLVADLIKRYQGMLLTKAPTTAPSPSPAAAVAAAPSIQAAGAPGTQPAGTGRRGGRGRGARGGGNLLPAAGYAGNMIPPATTVDQSVFGTLPLEIYQLTGDARYLPIGKKSADDQWSKTTPEGLTTQSRFWVDDVFMITAVQTNAYRATKDPVYLDRAATQMVAYLDKLQSPNGLFPHGLDVPAYWGRGDGWVAAGLTELLTNLPKDHPKYARIMDGYQKMMAALVKYQRPDGTWSQLIDQPDSWAETSGTGMFTFALASGVRNGWLDAAVYKEPARRAWIGLSAYLTPAGTVREVCSGTNKYDMTQGAKGMIPYYLNRPRIVGDLHGQAAFIWAAWAVAK